MNLIVAVSFTHTPIYYRLQLAKAPHCCSLIYIAHHLNGDINNQSLNIYKVHLLDQSLVIFLAAVFQQGLPEEFSFKVNVTLEDI